MMSSEIIFHNNLAFICHCSSGMLRFRRQTAADADLQKKNSHQRETACWCASVQQRKRVDGTAAHDKVD